MKINDDQENLLDDSNNNSEKNITDISEHLTSTPSISNTKNIIHLGFGSFFLFVGFNTLQNFEGTLNHSLGIWSLSTIYLSFSLSGFISSYMIQLFGEKWTLPFGGTCYVIYMAANFYPRYYTLIPTAALLGFGAAILWASQGAYIGKNSNNSTLDYHSGLLWAIFISNGLFGNLAAGLFVNYGNGNDSWLIAFFVGCGIFGTLLYVFLPSVPRSGEKNKAVSFTETFFLFFELKMLLIMSMLIYNGLSQSYFYSVMPSLFGKKNIGYIMSTFSFFDAIFSVIGGWVAKKYGRKSALFLATLMGGIGYVLVISEVVKEGSDIWKYYFAISFFGANDGVYSAVMFGIITIFQPNKLESGNAYLNLIRATFTGIAFAYSQYLSLISISIIALFWLVIGLITFFICDFFVEKVDKKEEK